MNKKEYMILGRLNQLSPDGQDFPVLHAGGEFIVDSGAEEPMRVSSSVVLKQATLPPTYQKKHQRQSFIVMQKLGRTL